VGEVTWSYGEVLGAARALHRAAYEKVRDPFDTVPLDKAWDNAHPQDQEYWLGVARSSLEGLSADLEIPSTEPIVPAGVELTEMELKALDLTAQLANTLREVIGEGDQSENDWAQLVAHIHGIQWAVMGNLASRAHPGLFRRLGGWDKPDGT
jgi:hypothetical protein